MGSTEFNEMMLYNLFLLVTLSGNSWLSPVLFFQNNESIEKAKIEFLLKEVEKLQGAKFWRNGSAHSAQDAADHLRMKWKKAGSTVKTANDFIDKIGSQSSISGNAYEIEFSDGTKMETRAFFYEQLAEWKP